MNSADSYPTVKLPILMRITLQQPLQSSDITKMADQLDHSMGSYMTYFQVLCILLAAVMIYLLTKADH